MITCSMALYSFISIDWRRCTCAKLEWASLRFCLWNSLSKLALVGLGPLWKTLCQALPWWDWTWNCKQQDHASPPFPSLWPFLLITFLLWVSLYVFDGYVCPLSPLLTFYFWGAVEHLSNVEKLLIIIFTPEWTSYGTRSIWTLWYLDFGSTREGPIYNHMQCTFIWYYSPGTLPGKLDFNERPAHGCNLHQNAMHCYMVLISDGTFTARGGGSVASQGTYLELGELYFCMVPIQGKMYPHMVHICC